MYKCSFEINHKNCWLADVSKEFPQNSFIDNEAYLLPDGNLMDIILIQGNKHNFPKIVHSIRKSPLAKGVRILEKTSKYLFLQVISNKERMDFLTPIIAEHNCIRIGNVFAKEGYEHWIVGAPQKSDTLRLLEKLKEHGKIRKKHITKIPLKAPLTKRQTQAIDLAFRHGYFNVPRRINLTQLAKKMGIQKSACREHLIRAQQKLVGMYMEE